MLNSHLNDEKNQKNEAPRDAATLSSGYTLNYFQNEWVEKLLDPNNSSELKSPVLVFALKDKPVTIDRSAGEVVTIYPGNQYKDIGGNKYEINPQSYDELVKLFEALKAKNLLPKQLVYLWTMDDAGLDAKKLLKIAGGEASILDMGKACLSVGVNYVFNLLKSILQLKIKDLSRLMVIYQKEKGLANPFYEMIGSYGNSLGYVLPELTFSTIQIDDGSVIDKLIFNELQDEAPQKEILYKDKKRYIKKLKRVNLGESNKPELKKDATYLVTGGAGGLGLLFARYLVEKYQANLILVGRSELNQKKQGTITELEKHGSKVVYLKADVSDIGQMEKVIKTSKEMFGNINGIIHAAGLMSEKLISQKTLGEFEAIIQSKVMGTIVLDELTKEEPIDFLVLFSSTSSVIGDFGQCDYSVGNRFMDCYSNFREAIRKQNGRSGRTITINWPLWEEGGMHQNKETEALYLQASGMGYLQKDDGIEAFENIVGSNEAQIMVMYGNTEKIEGSLGTGVRQTPKVVEEKPSQKVETPDYKYIKGESVEQNFESDLKKLAAEILKLSVDKLDSTVNIGNFGFDSISLKVFADKISGKYDIEVSPTIFFSANTIRSLTENLIGEYQEHITSYYNISNANVSGTAGTISDEGVLVKQNSYLEPLKNRMPGLSRFSADSRSSGGGSYYEPIAVIGVSGLFPGSDTLDELWDNLEAEKDLITEVPISRWDWREYYSEDLREKNKSVSKCGGFINDVDKFDAQFFSISPLEAELMDPQHRLLLQTVWKAIEDAGYKASELSGRSIGAFVGFQFSDYQDLLQELGEIRPQIPTGNSHAVLTNRISYFMNFRGPSESIDTACSGSLVAIHRAIRSIQNGESEMAIAGGVSLMLSPKTFLSASKLGILSIDNCCKTFDKSANGYVRGEGIGALVLKPLRQAVLDHDHIYAVIKGSAENHGGRANSLTAPNSDAQAAVLVRAYQEAGIAPNTITYIEAHGTGTELGDPVEIEGLKKAFKELYKVNRITPMESAYCGVGSIKTNIGHLEPAAGIAGILKVILSLKNKKLPASINFKELNPYIDLKNSPFYIVTETKNWDRLKDKKGNEIPRRGGVSSFGFGGANAHIVLEEYEELYPSVPTEEPQIVVLSAKNSERLKEYAADLLAFLSKEQNTAPAAYSPIKDIERDLIQTAAQITSIEEDYFSADENLKEYGFDTYKYVELIDAVSAKFGIEINPAALKDKVSISAIAEYLNSTFKDCMSQFYINDSKDNHQMMKGHRLEDIAFTLQLGREAMDERLAIVVRNGEELKEYLQHYLNDQFGTDIFTENIKGNKCNIEIFDNDEDANKMIDQWISKKKLAKIAKLWVNGCEINWSRLHQNTTHKRISLPTYPFKKERHWIPERSNDLSANNQRGFGTLLDSMEYDLSLGSGVVFYKKLNNQPSIAKDHVIKGQNIFPGVGYLEMAYQAAVAVKGNTNFQISRVFWINPLILSKEEQKVLISLKKEEQKILFEVKSPSQVIYAKGEIHNQDYDSQSVQSISLEDIKRRCTQTVSGDYIYKHYEAKEINYGPFFRGITQVFKNNQEALGVLNFSVNSGPGLNHYSLHPTLLDSALQIIGCIKETGEKLLLPFNVERIELLRPLRPMMYAYAKASGSNSFHVAIIDEDGNVCVKFYNFTLKEIRNKFEDLYYRLAWSKNAVIPKIGNIDNQGQNETNMDTVLIVYADDGQGIAERISANYRKTLQLKLGSANTKHSDSLWEIKADDPKAIEDSILSLTSIDTIYFLGGIQSKTLALNDFDTLKETQEKGVISLFRLIKALESKDLLQQSLKIKVITNNVYSIDHSPMVLPVAAGIHGFLKSLSKEYPKLNITAIDIDLPESGNQLSTETIDLLIRPVFSEPNHPDGETIVYRNNERYVRTLEPMQLSEVSESIFEENGVYMIIGGAGGIGLELSRYLAKKVKARLFLVGRSKLSDAKKVKIKEIEDLGGTVIYCQADITNKESMQKAIQKIKARLGAINGVFHAAIVSADKTVRNMNEKEFHKALDPKVTGSAVLYSVLQNEKLDFIAFFSSTSSVAGMPGQSNYVSGLNFKDAFANYIQKKTDYPVKIFNWGFWGIGSGDVEGYASRLRLQGIYAINPEEGMETIERVLKSPENQVFILKAERRVFERLGVFTKEEKLETVDASKYSKSEFFTTTRNQTIMTDVFQETQESRLSNLLKTIFSKVLKMDKAKIDDKTSFNQFGVDSLLGLEIHANIEKSLGELPPTLLLENTNLDTLINYLFKNHREKIDLVLGKSVVKTDNFDLFDSVAATKEEFNRKEAAIPEQTIVTDVSQNTLEDRLIDLLKTVFSKVLKMDKEKMDNGTSFGQFGVDSLLGLEIHANLEKSLGELPPTMLLDNTNFTALTSYLLKNHREKLNSVLVKNAVKANNTDLFSSDTAPKEEIIEKETPQLGLLQDKKPDIELPVHLDSFLVEFDSNAKAEVSSIGAGTPVLLVPGFAVTSLLSAYQIKSWSNNYRIISINLPGHGRSDAIDDLSFSGISKMMMKVIDKLGISQPLHVAGASFGGMIAQNIAKEYPHRVKTLSLMGSFTVSKFEGVSQYFSFVESVRKDFEVVRNTTKSQEIIDNIDYYFNLYKASQVTNRSLMLKYLDLMKLGMTTRDILAQIKAPSLVIVGALDSVVDPEESKILHSEIKNSKYAEIPDGGHFISLTHHDMVNKLVLDFLAEHGF